jgi:GT2 family glycosyltransferase
VNSTPFDIVIPFFGSEAALHDLAGRLRMLRLAPGDSLIVVDNRPRPRRTERAVDGVRVISAPERQSSYFARNAGARAGCAEWIIFLDADVEPAADLVERYREAEPAPGTGLLGGGIIDGPPLDGGGHGIAARYAILRGSMAQDNTLGHGRWAYVQTANCAVRRAALYDIGGFRDNVRSGGDADFGFRLRAAGWAIERCYSAAVVHRSRPSMRRMLAQRARHGSGAAWLNRVHPGSFPPARWSGLVVFAVRSLLTAARDLAAGRRDQAVIAYVEPLSAWAYELGRSIPNESDRPPSGVLTRGLERLLLG